MGHSKALRSHGGVTAAQRVHVHPGSRARGSPMPINTELTVESVYRYTGHLSHNILVLHHNTAAFFNLHGLDLPDQRPLCRIVSCEIARRFAGSTKKDRPYTLISLN